MMMTTKLTFKSDRPWWGKVYRANQVVQCAVH